jgi:hypothetical protein
MLTLKLFLVLALASCQCYAQETENFEAQWQILVNLLGDEGLDQPADTVAGSLLTIIRGLLPRFDPPKPAPSPPPKPAKPANPPPEM